jgi:hypothetical protein
MRVLYPINLSPITTKISLMENNMAHNNFMIVYSDFPILFKMIPMNSETINGNIDIILEELYESTIQ